MYKASAPQTRPMGRDDMGSARLDCLGAWVEDMCCCKLSGSKASLLAIFLHCFGYASSMQ